MRWGWPVLAAAALLVTSTQGLTAQDAAVTGSEVTLSSGMASLEVNLSDGVSRVVSLSDGDVLIDGQVAGSYEPGGSLDRSWRELLGSEALFQPAEVAAHLAEWVPDASNDAEAASGEALEAVFDRLAERSNQTTAAAIPETATVARPGGGQVAIAPGVLSLKELTRSVDVLRGSLDRLGSQAAGVDENLALVVHDDFAIGAEHVVDGNLALLSGDLQLDGVVDGSVLVLDGTLTLGPSARIEGDVLQVGGDVIDSGGRVGGELVSLVAGNLAEVLDTDIGADLDIEVPSPVRVHVEPSGRGFVGGIGHNIGHAFGGVFGTLAWWLALGALGMAVVYFFRQRLEVVADTVRSDMVRSFGVGLAGQLLVIPVLLILVIGIVTWLVIPVYALAVALAIPAGYLAVAHGVGETVAEQRFDWMERHNLRRTNSYYYVFSGLAFLLAPFAIGSALYLLGGWLGFVRGLMFFAAGVLTWAAITTGFGAIILTRAGGRRGGRATADFDDLFSAPSFDDEEGEVSA